MVSKFLTLFAFVRCQNGATEAMLMRNVPIFSKHFKSSDYKKNHKYELIYLFKPPREL